MWVVITSVLGPTNYSKTVGSRFQKADSWQRERTVVRELQTVGCRAGSRNVEGLLNFIFGKLILFSAN